LTHPVEEAGTLAPSTPSSSYRAGIRAAIPFALASLAFGVSFGALAASAGIGRVAAIVMSATTWAGSAQFAVVSVLATGGSAAAAVTAGVLLNARYGAMAIALAPSLSPRRLRRALEALALADESWALANRPDGRFDRKILVGAALALYVGWLVGTVLGVLGGAALGDPTDLGLDAAFPALFLALLAPQLGSRDRRVAALLGGAIALALTPFTPPGIPIVAAAAAALYGLRR
jgi:4-azaleucine resistance transporter AzlC